jgi:bacterial/archaeal transporter family protein
MLYLFAFFSLTVLWAFRDIITKKILKHSDPDVMAGITGLLIAVSMLPFLIFQGIPETVFSWSFLTALILGWACYFGGKYLSFTSYKLGDISYITPLKGLTTVFSIFTAFLIFGQIPSIWGFIGIIFIFIGTYTLGFKKNIWFFGPIRHLFTEKSSQIYLMAVFFYGFSIPIDKWWVEASTPFFWVFCMNLVLFLWTFKKVVRERKVFLKEVSPYMGRFFLWTFLQILNLLSYLYCIERMPVSYVSGFKTASIIFVVLIGGYIFQEKDLRKRSFASLIVFLGLLCIIFSEVAI